MMKRLAVDTCRKIAGCIHIWLVAVAVLHQIILQAEAGIAGIDLALVAEFVRINVNRRHIASTQFCVRRIAKSAEAVTC